MREKRRMFVCKIIVGIGVILCILGGCGSAEERVELTEITAEEQEEVSAEDAQEEQVETEEPQEAVKEIYVYVCGEVRSPGVYKLNENDRVTHALQAAGGMTDEAAESFLNQAELLVDGQKIYVPDKEEAAAMESKEQVQADVASDGRVNINTADIKELTSLNGIGTTRAEAILNYRETNGKFSSVEDIKKVDGIKDGIFEKIKDQIKVE